MPEKFRLDDRQFQQFGIYLDLILQWNQRAGLISSADEERLIKRHIIESLGVLSLNILMPPAHVLDLGTGGGFPGIPIKIAMPELHMTLLDSRRMKARFLEEVVGVLGLQNLQVVNGRAEKLAANPAAQFDFIVARAVTDLETLWTWSQPLLKKSGSLLAQKGGDLGEEMKRFQKAFPNLTPLRCNYPDPWPIDPSRYVIAIRKEK